MGENVLEVKNLSKKLGKREIIKDVSFDVKQGEIFGFLGANGAGKTTTIRMLVGLIAANSGSIKVVGCDIKKQREKALAQIGAVVENPELYTYLSGYDNLMVIAKLRKIPKSAVDEVVEIVGLKDRINDKVKKYSLGMKQRLGLATALLSKPKLLILDEPTNGLDPSGILDFREIIRNVSKTYNTSVFISSHILSEVQELCDTVAFINGGKIVAVEKMEGGKINKEEETLVLVTSEIEKAQEFLGKLSYIKSVNLVGAELRILAQLDKSEELVKALVENDIKVRELYIRHKELEERYMELVEGGLR